MKKIYVPKYFLSMSLLHIHKYLYPKLIQIAHHWNMTRISLIARMHVVYVNIFYIVSLLSSLFFPLSILYGMT